MTGRDPIRFRALVKSFDNNQPEDPMAPVKWVNMLDLLPEQDAQHFDRIMGITMTYDGHLNVGHLK